MTATDRAERSGAARLIPGASGSAGRVLGSPQSVEAAAIGLLGSTLFVAAIPALDAYRVGGATPVVAAAAGGSVLAPLCGARLFRLAPAGSYCLSAAGLAALLLAADGPHPVGVIRSIAHGPSRILTETLPLAGGRSALGALLVLVWICGAATGEVALRTAGRARSSFALAIPVGLYLICFAAASSSPGRDRYGGPLLLVGLALAAALLRERSRPAVQAAGGPEDGVHTRRRTAATVVVAPAAAAILFSVVVPTVPGLGRRPAALHRRPPTAAPVITDPLGSMAQLRDGDPRSRPVPELSVALSEPSTGYLAMGDLDLYDGALWRFSADFQPSGGRVPAAPGAPALLAQKPVTQQVDVTGALPVPLLPALDRPLSVTGLRVAADAASGMLLPQAPGAARSYAVVSAAPDRALQGLSPADGIDQAQAGADLQLPAGTSAYLATTLRFLSSLTGQHPAATVGFLQDALQVLHAAEKRIDPTIAPPATPGPPSATTTTVAPAGGSGTSLSEVINAVTVQRAATPEQFATFFALVARYLGVPARVVTGFRLSGDSSGQPLPAGAYQVTNRQAWAWVEIPVQGFGWVVCDPTPDATTAVATPPPVAESAPATTVPPRQANAVPRSRSEGGHALAPPQHVRVPRGSQVSPWVLAGLASAGLLSAVAALGPGSAALRRALRRRRRRSADPVHLAVGAWLELLDGLDRAGMRPSPGATASEIAQDVGHHFGAELVGPAAGVAATADRAVFCTASPVPADMALEAWATSQELCGRVLGYLDGRQRIKSMWTVGSAPNRPSGPRR